MQGNFNPVTSISVTPRIMMEEWLHSCPVPSLPLYRLVWDQGRSTQLTWWHSGTRVEASQSLLLSQHVSDIKNCIDKPRHLDMISSASSLASTLLVVSHCGFLYLCFLFVLSHWFEVGVIHLEKPDVCSLVQQSGFRNISNVITVVCLHRQQQYHRIDYET